LCRIFEKRAKIINPKIIEKISNKLYGYFIDNYKMTDELECTCSQVTLKPGGFKKLWEKSSEGSFEDFIEYWKIVMQNKLGPEYEMFIYIGTETEYKINYNVIYKTEEYTKIRDSETPIVLRLVYDPERIPWRITRSFVYNFKLRKTDDTFGDFYNKTQDSE
jgi:hypothetical protein